MTVPFALERRPYGEDHTIPQPEEYEALKQSQRYGTDDGLIDGISQAVLNNSLDAQTAYEIVSIDVAEIDVGVNIGANLQAEQAAADLRVAQANAEKRRALAVALEQEMRARVEENRAAVVLAEAEVPKALAQAFREGHLGVMDYYNMRNVQSDTQMRNAIASVGGGKDRGDRAGS